MSDEIDKALPITVYCDKPFFLTAPSQSAINTDALDIVDFFDTRGFELEAHNPISSLIEPTKNAVVFFSKIMSASYKTIISPVAFVKISFQAADTPLLKS